MCDVAYEVLDPAIQSVQCMSDGWSDAGNEEWNAVCGIMEIGDGIVGVGYWVMGIVNRVETYTIECSVYWMFPVVVVVGGSGSRAGQTSI